jgi:tRNA-splicing ligase RtcB
VGFEKNNVPMGLSAIGDVTCALMDGLGGLGHVMAREYATARRSLGTLGGGNHFIEIQKGSDGYIWVMLHSGSRNPGKQVADYYNKKAIELNEKYYSQIPQKWELAFLPLDSEDGQEYMEEMRSCVEYAFINRKLMIDRIVEVFKDVINESEQICFDPMINIAHNYATMEHHFGKNVLVHRKGATSAKNGEIGIIPGSQGTSSYIVKGRGNMDSFMSCSHGAGRKMGRKQAERTLNLEEEVKKLNDRGILHAIRGVGDLDEASGAYKDIDVVMKEQEDLVEIMVKLEPLAVIKG